MSALQRIQAGSICWRNQGAYSLSPDTQRRETGRDGCTTTATATERALDFCYS